MIQTQYIRINTAYPQMSLQPFVAFTGSPSTLRIADVPRKLGTWQIKDVYVVVNYPGNETQTIHATRAGGIWQATIPASSLAGQVDDGYGIYANGTDENDMPVDGYCLGRGYVKILGDFEYVDGTSYRLTLREQLPEQPLDGDVVWFEDDNCYKLFSDGEWKQLGGGAIAPATETRLGGLKATAEYLKIDEEGDIVGLSANHADSSYESTIAEEAKYARKVDDGTEGLSDYAKKSYVDNALSAKADKPVGITPEEEDEFWDNYMPAITPSGEIKYNPNLKIGIIPDELDELWNGLAEKADKSELDEKADKSELAEKADKSELDEKADKSELDEKADRSELNEKADKSELAEKADRSELAEKADRSELAEKADRSELSAKADKSELSAKADKPVAETAETAKTLGIAVVDENGNLKYNTGMTVASLSSGGGGDTVVAGNNVSISTDAQGNKVINAGGNETGSFILRDKNVFIGPAEGQAGGQLTISPSNKSMQIGGLSAYVGDFNNVIATYDNTDVGLVDYMNGKLPSVSEPMVFVHFLNDSDTQRNTVLWMYSTAGVLSTLTISTYEYGSALAAFPIPSDCAKMVCGSGCQTVWHYKNRNNAQYGRTHGDTVKGAHIYGPTDFTKNVYCGVEYHQNSGGGDIQQHFTIYQDYSTNAQNFQFDVLTKSGLNYTINTNNDSQSSGQFIYTINMSDITYIQSLGNGLVGKLWYVANYGFTYDSFDYDSLYINENHEYTTRGDATFVVK